MKIIKNTKNKFFVSQKIVIFRDKKGIAAMTFIVGIIILLLCAGVLYAFYITFGGIGQVDRQACASSVLIRGTLPDTMLFKAKEYAPLSCKTQKFCISDKIFGSDCEEFKGEKYTKVKVSSNPSKMNAQINAFMAKEAAECWSMMGEGKLQVFTRPTLAASGKKSCVVCDRVAFDKSVKSKLTKIIGLNSYMTTHFVPNTNPKISFMDYILRIKLSDDQLVNDFLSLNEKAIVYTEFDSTTLYKWTNSLLGGGAGAIIGCKAGAAVGAGIGCFVIPVVGAVPVGAIGCIFGFSVGLFVGAEYTDAADDFLKRSSYYPGEYILDNSKEGFKAFELECDSFEDIP